MFCLRLDLNDKLLPFLEGGLTPPETERLKDHLGRCASCRKALAGLQAGRKAACELGRMEALDPAPGPPLFDELPAAVREAASGRPKFTSGWMEGLHVLTARPLVSALAALVVILSGLLIVTNRTATDPSADLSMTLAAALDWSSFHPLRIPDLPSNTRTRIVTEGYVRNVHYDAEEGTLHFRLSDVPQASGPFVVCEIMNPIVVPQPREGSRVRVYGVARYDAKPGREWHEVNPVLNITELKR